MIKSYLSSVFYLPPENRERTPLAAALLVLMEYRRSGG
jgi:hypothetical protein